MPHIINIFAGIWLMAAPAVLGYAGTAATNDRIVGPIIASFACIAAYQVTRECRWINVVMAGWLIPAPWILGGFSAEATLNSTAVGILVMSLSLARGRITHPFGGGWREIWPRNG